MRRSWVVGLLAASVLLLGGCNWPMFGFQAAGTRASPDTSISSSMAATGSPSAAWAGVTNGIVEASPVVAHGVLYVADDDNQLYAFDATGNTNCSGAPKSCAPLWTAATGPATGLDRASPTVADGAVYIGSDDHRLYAFDASGTTNCSGVPKTCAPLWTATTGGTVFSPPVVANGVVYVGSDDQDIYAFDAAGTTNCSGTPKTCAPLWTATTHGPVRASPAVANGVLYVGSDALYAFDAAGTTNCAGDPKTCQPLWTAATAAAVSGIAIANGMVYVGAGSLSPSGFGELAAFSASGTTNCLALRCSPIWRAGLANAASAPALANGVVYIGAYGGALYAFDAAGSTGCTQGAARVCQPLWLGATGAGSLESSPAVANGVVYIGGQSSGFYQLLAFDASGSTNCSGAPKTCAPIYSSNETFLPLHSSPAVANGYVYIGDLDRESRGRLVNLDVAAFHFG